VTFLKVNKSNVWKSTMMAIDPAWNQKMSLLKIIKTWWSCMQSTSQMWLKDLFYTFPYCKWIDLY